MIDSQTARQGALCLSTAIAELMEDFASDAAALAGASQPDQSAQAIHRASQDLGALAAALVILTRPS